MNIYDNQYLGLKESKIQEVLSGKKTVTEVCKELEISRPSMYTWLSRYKRFGITGLVHRKKLHKQTPVNRTRNDV